MARPTKKIIPKIDASFDTIVNAMLKKNPTVQSKENKKSTDKKSERI